MLGEACSWQHPLEELQPGHAPLALGRASGGHSVEGAKAVPTQARPAIQPRRRCQQAKQASPKDVLPERRHREPAEQELQHHCEEDSQREHAPAAVAPARVARYGRCRRRSHHELLLLLPPPAARASPGSLLAHTGLGLWRRTSISQVHGRAGLVVVMLLLRLIQACQVCPRLLLPSLGRGRASLWDYAAEGVLM